MSRVSPACSPASSSADEWPPSPDRSSQSPRVCQALVTAAARLSHPDDFANPKQLLRIDGAPIITHLLKGLHSVGITRVVITLGHAASALADIIRQEDFGEMRVEFVWCEDTWKRGHATNIMATRSMFRPGEPLLVVMSDMLFDWRLLAKMAHTTSLDGSDAVALIDDREDMVKWATQDHCRAFCKNGHCHSLVKVLRGTDGQVSQIGKKLDQFDALEAGAYAVTPKIFDTLARLRKEASYCTLVDAMRMLAQGGRLRYERTAGVSWFSSLTVSAAALGENAVKLPQAVRPEWVSDARKELQRTSPKLLPQEASLASTPLYSLGAPIGEGMSSVVVEGRRESADAPPDAGGCSSSAARRAPPTLDAGAQLAGGFGAAGCAPCEGGGGSPRAAATPVAVKVVPKGSQATSEACIMREVSNLKLLSHEHIVKVMDVIDVVDATYIVMQRVDGPELTDFIEMQRLRRIPAPVARVFCCHLLSALRHAHARGLIHCDVKPPNVRLNAQCDKAVLTDWGLARAVRTTTEPVRCGTALYASPEQLTGYDPDSVCGAACCLTEAVDVWGLGATLFEMLAGEPPFCGRTADDLVRNVLGLRYRLPAHAPAGARALLASIFQLAPLERASLDEVAQSAWLQEANLLTAAPGLSLRRAASSELLMRAYDFELECAECAPEDAEAGGGRLPAAYYGEDGAADDDCKAAKAAARPPRRPALRRALVVLFYLAMCALALWSNMRLSAPLPSR